MNKEPIGWRGVVAIIAIWALGVALCTGAGWLVYHGARWFTP